MESVSADNLGFSDDFQMILRLFSGYFQILWIFADSLFFLRLFSDYSLIILRLFSGYSQIILRWFSDDSLIILWLFSGNSLIILRWFSVYSQIILCHWHFIFTGGKDTQMLMTAYLEGFTPVVSALLWHNYKSFFYFLITWVEAGHGPIVNLSQISPMSWDWLKDSWRQLCSITTSPSQHL